MSEVHRVDTDAYFFRAVGREGFEGGESVGGSGFVGGECNGAAVERVVCEDDAGGSGKIVADDANVVGGGGDVVVSEN